MTDPRPRTDILPSNSTPRERAIADADAAIADLDVAQIVTARDPQLAPLPVLSRLAWERSVDVWDPTWSETIKRAVVAAAPEVHRHKGTVYAVKTALAALQVDATVSEWWQETPRGEPYTFKVKAYGRARLYDGPVLDARLIKVIFTSILRTKPESRAFDLTIGAMFPSTLGVAAAARAKIVRRAPLKPVLDAHGRQSLGLAGVALGKVVSRQALHPRFALHSGASLGMAGIVLGRARVNVSFLLRSP